jgi:predicted transposase YbfD/YdcC
MAHSILTHFASLPDPRGCHGRLHRLDDMLTIAICGVICGADSWTEIQQFGEAKRGWFQTFLQLPRGIPSHDTFGRLFAALDPDAFEACFIEWMRALAEQSGGRLVAVDGKTLRRSFEHAWNRTPIHMVSAFAGANNLVFGQLATDAKSNEITAIPKLLALLDLKGATVTIDAMGCQKAIARQIVEAGGAYVLAVKENQPTLHRKVKALMDEAMLEHFNGVLHDRCEDIDGDHGRIEKRRLWCTPEVQWVEEARDWAGLRSFAVVESTRMIGTKATTERRYYISSLSGTDADAMARAVRSHWGIENKLHWSLDMAFREDECRIRSGHGAENFSRLRRIALNLLKRDKSIRVGVKAKRLRAGWDHDYLLRVIQT